MKKLTDIIKINKPESPTYLCLIKKLFSLPFQKWKEHTEKKFLVLAQHLNECISDVPPPKGNVSNL